MQGPPGPPGGAQQPMAYANPGGVVDAMLQIIMSQGQNPMNTAMQIAAGYQMYKSVAPAPQVPALDAMVSIAQRKMTPHVMANQSGQMPASALNRLQVPERSERPLSELEGSMSEYRRGRR